MISTPYQRRDHYGSQSGEEDLLEEAITKLTSAALYLRKMKEKQHHVQDSGNDYKVQRKSGRKRNRPLIKNICRDAIDFIDSNFPENLNFVSEKYRETKEDDESKLSNSGKEEENKCSNNLTSVYAKTKTKDDKMDTSIVPRNGDVTRKQISYPHQIIGAEVPRKNLLRVALNSSVSDFSWCALVCGHQEKSLEMLANLEDFDINEREIILEKFILAKSLWTCKKCKTFSSMEAMLSGFAICKLCQHWFHRNCCENGGDGQSQLGHLTDEFVCEECVSLFFEDVAQEPIQGEDIIPSQGALQFQTVAVGAPISVSDITEKIDMEGNTHEPPKLIQGENIEFIQAQPATDTQELAEGQITSGPQIYYQLPPNMSFPPSGEGHYVVQLQGNTVQQIGFEVL